MNAEPQGIGEEEEEVVTEDMRLAAGKRKKATFHLILVPIHPRSLGSGTWPAKF